jgi:hypothetical protein
MWIRGAFLNGKMMTGDKAGKYLTVGRLVFYGKTIWRSIAINRDRASHLRRGAWRALTICLTIAFQL